MTLFTAANPGQIDLLRLLTMSGVKVDQKNERGETYLSTFGFFDDEVAQELLKAGADPNARDKRGATALMRASAYGFEPVVQVLIQRGADVHLTDYNGQRALMYAAEGVEREHYVDSIPQLLAKGADINRRDKDGKTALDIAASAKHKYAIEILRQRN